MTTYILGADEITGHERATIKEVEKILKSKGHTVINVGVGANVVQNASLRKSADVAVQIVGGLDGEVFADYAWGIGKYYKVKKFISPLCSWIYKNKPASDFHHKQNVPHWRMVQAHDAKGRLRKMYIGKTISQFMKEYPNVKVFGADTPKEIADGILGLDTGKKKKKSKSRNTYLEMIKDLVKPWDGEAEVYTRGNRVYIHKIPLPDDNKVKRKSDYDKKGGYHFRPSNDLYYASEGINILDNSVTVHDYNPNTINDLTVTYYDKKSKKNKKLFLRDNFMITRFGKQSKTVKAVRLKADNSLKDVLREEKAAKKQKKKTKNKGKTKKKKSKSKKTKKTKKKKKEKTVKSRKDKNQDKSSMLKVPITNLLEAKKFARAEWYRNMRNNGHGVDVEVIGNHAFQEGTWCHFYAPTFGENLSMYIAQVDHSLAPNKEWTTKLHLVDYPPSISSLDDKDYS